MVLYKEIKIEGNGEQWSWGSFGYELNTTFQSLAARCTYGVSLSGFLWCIDSS